MRNAGKLAVLLTANQADVNLHNKHDETALALAAARNADKIAWALLNYKADVNAPDRDGATPLMKACRNNALEVRGEPS